MVVPRAKVTPALFWDMSDPYHYVRLADEPRDDGTDILLVGGEDHRTGQGQLSELRYRELERWARKRFPMAGDVVQRWSGQVMEPIDGVAFIGPSPGSSNVLVITGDSGHGITHGVIGSILCTEHVFGRSHEWAPLYDPGRRSLRAMREYVRDGIASVRQYGAWLRAGDVSERGEIPPGSGAVVRRGLKKIAVYRDEQGDFHELSAVCPHLGGVVTWNSAERTWDCPCHGSRFDAQGHVINAPATEDLEAADGDNDRAQANRPPVSSRPIAEDRPQKAAHRP
jgi:nitrite reductase/ring-hydroxylating ferredoxin subunit